MMLAMFPQKALILFGVLFVIAVVTGVLTDFAGERLRKKKGDAAMVQEQGCCDEGFEIHEHEDTKPRGQRHFGWRRAVLSIGLAAFIVALGFGFLEHDHEDGHDNCCNNNTELLSETPDTDVHQTLKIDLLNETWMNVLFACLSVIMLGVIIFASDHFIDEHLWHHVIRKHFLNIFLWTFGVLSAIAILMHFIDISSWISDNTALMILFAVAVGIIPESGPHLIFVTLYAAGIVPFPVLLASSISQDGHASIPLLAESKSAFLKAKLLNCFVALVCGFAAMLL